MLVAAHWTFETLWLISILNCCFLHFKLFKVCTSKCSYVYKHEGWKIVRSSLVLRLYMVSLTVMWPVWIWESCGPCVSEIASSYLYKSASSRKPEQTWFTNWLWLACGESRGDRFRYAAFTRIFGFWFLDGIFFYMQVVLFSYVYMYFYHHLSQQWRMWGPKFLKLSCIYFYFMYILYMLLLFFF